MRWQAWMLLAVAVQNGEAAPACVKYEDSLSDGTLGFCAGIVNYEYYTQDSLITQDKLEGLALVTALGTEQSFARSLMTMLLPLVGDKCQAQIKLAACLRAFPRCAKVDPFFVNAGPCDANGLIPTLNGRGCSPKLGIQAGTANTPWTKATCEQSNLFFTDGKCFAALPRFGCKAKCSALTETSTKSNFVGGIASENIKEFEAPCPLISADWNVIAQQQYSQSPDQTRKIQFDNAAKGTNKMTLGLLGAVGAAQICVGTSEFIGSSDGGKISLQLFPESVQDNLVSLLNLNIGLAGNNCGPVKCSEVAAAATCNNDHGASTIQSSIAIADPKSTCGPLVYGSANQSPTFLRFATAGLAIKQNNLAEAAKCFSTTGFEGAYFVPPFPGMLPMAPKLDALKREKQVDNLLSVNCSVVPGAAGRPEFANVAGATPLCVSSIDPSKVGHNARDCLLIKADDLTDTKTRGTQPACRAAFLEMACGATHMKVEAKLLCLSANGCDETPNDVLKAGHMMFLPRFPSSDTCAKFKSECAYLNSPEVDNFPCGSTVQQSLAASLASAPPRDRTLCTDPNSLQIKGKQCEVSATLGALKQYPSLLQDFGSADVKNVFGKFINNINALDSAMQTTFRTSVLVPTKSAVLYGTSALSPEAQQQLNREFCECPAPLKPANPLLNQSIGPFCCALPCEGTMLTRQEMDGLGIFSLILNTIGILCALFMVATWGTFENKRRQYITFWFSFCSLMCSFALWFLVVHKGGDMHAAVCADDTTPHAMKTDGFSVCTFQSTWVLFFSLAECGWWFIQALDLYRKIVRKERDTEATKRNYHILAWGVATLGTGGFLALQLGGFGAPTPFCFFSFDADAVAQYVFYFVFVMVFFVGGVYLMTRVLLTIREHSQMAVAQQEGSSGRKWAKQMNLYRTPITFVFMFVSVWIIIFSFRLTATFNQSTFEAQAKAYVGCLLLNFAGGVSDPANNPLANNTILGDPDLVGCGAKQRGGIPFTLTFVMFLAVSSQSIAVFLIFGLKAENFSLWRQAFGCEARKINTQESVGSSFKTEVGAPGGYPVASPYLSQQVYGQQQQPFQPGMFSRPPQQGYPGQPQFSQPYNGGGYPQQKQYQQSPRGMNQARPYKGGFDPSSGRGDFNQDDI